MLDGADAVVGLNGASIGRFPWTRDVQEHAAVVAHHADAGARPRGARARGGCARRSSPPPPSGYYGSAPGARLTENAPRGESFLADLCGEWEAAALRRRRRTRASRCCAPPRSSTATGVLKPLLLLTKLGVSGPIGRGTQVWPWISLDDEVAGDPPRHRRAASPAR